MNRVRAAAVATLAAVSVAGCSTGTPHAGPAPDATSSPAATSAAPSVTVAPPVAPSVTSGPTPVPSLLVAGRSVPAAGIHDVAAALRVAGVSVRDGRLLSVVTGRVLQAHVTRGHVEVNGRRATATTPVGVGDVVSVIAGADRVESTHRIRVPVGLDAAAASLYTHVTPGVGDATVGVLSGERASVDVVQAPVVGALRRAARLALTIDDGPSPAFTPQVLDLVATAHVAAVFCLIGAHARAEAALVRQEVADGAQLCDHTQNHPLNLPLLSPSRIAVEIRDGFTSVKTASAGVAPTYFRAPGGNWSTRIDADARALHLVPLHWTVDPRDWSRPGTATILLRVLNQLRPDGIVLVHDGGGDRSQTVAALRQLLPELTSAGWQFRLPTWVR